MNNKYLLLMVALFGGFVTTLQASEPLVISSNNSETSVADHLYNAASLSANYVSESIKVITPLIVEAAKSMGQTFLELSPKNKVFAVVGAYVLYKAIRHSKVNWSFSIGWPNGLYLFDWSLSSKK